MDGLLLLLGVLLEDILLLLLLFLALDAGEDALNGEGERALRILTGGVRE